MSKFWQIISVLCIASCFADQSLSAEKSLKMDFRVPFNAKFHEKGKKRYRKTHKVEAVAKRPVVDGVLDEAIWAKLPSIEFNKGEVRTQVKACFDSDNLYLGFVCHEKPGGKTVGIARDRDGRIWLDDAIEICVAAPKYSTEKLSYHFIISSANSVYDTIWRGKKRIFYDPVFEHATKTGNDRWIVEVAIPVKALGRSEWVKEIGFNVGRDGPVLGPSFWGTRRDVAGSAFVFSGIDKVEVDKRTSASLASSVPLRGDAIKVHLDRMYARAGERWIKADLEFAPAKGALQNSKAVIKLFKVAENNPLEELSITPERNRGKLHVDLRKHNLEMADVSVEYFEGAERTAATRFTVTAKKCKSPLVPGERIPVRIDLPEGITRVEQYPVTFGTPFPAGALWDLKSIELVDNEGRLLPQQKEVTGRWGPEGSIRWVRFDALVTSGKGCFLQATGSGKRGAPTKAVSVTADKGKIIVDTGAARYVLAKGASPIEEILIDGKRVASSSGTRGLYVVDQKGRLAKASAEEESVTIEARGPVASCVRFEGWYKTEKGEKLARHITRVKCFAGRAEASITHTLILTQDTNSVWFKEIGWDFAVEAGDAAKAIFGVDPKDFGKSLSVALNNRAKSAYMLQDTHYMFAHGKNHFLISADEGKSALHEGKECGDYAALLGAAGGLGIVCRDAARQHPKEFQVESGRITLKLFSNRAGEELDFHPDALIKKWDAANWSKSTYSVFRKKAYRKKGTFVENIKRTSFNAAGWSKTHQISVIPAKTESKVVVSRKALLCSKQVYAHTAPAWIYRTRAMGTLYPKDVKRFPAIEEAVDSYFKAQVEADAKWGENGFVNYFAGPRFAYAFKGDKAYAYIKRWYYTYGLHPNMWLNYARSGERYKRDFVAGCSQAYMDIRMGHWDTAASRKGLLRGGPTDLPIDWGPGGLMSLGQSGSLNTYLWNYYLTGNRRAREVVENYALGCKKRFTPKLALHPTYPPYTLLRLVQTYGLTFDEDIHDLCTEMMDLLEDEESMLGISKYSSPKENPTYKSRELVRAYIAGWETTGETRYHKVARLYSEYLFKKRLLFKPVDSAATMGLTGSFMYEDKKDLAIAENLYSQVMAVPTFFDARTKKLKDPNLICSVNFDFVNRIGDALHVVAGSNVDRKPVASWVAYDDNGSETEVYVRKPDGNKVNMYFSAPGTFGGVNPLETVGFKKPYNNRLFRTVIDQCTIYSVSGNVYLSKDLLGGTYKLSFTGAGKHAIFADTNLPMVIHAPQYFTPLPKQRPASKLYFGLPKNNKDSQIFFEGKAVIYQPDGSAFAGGKVQHGWVDLPDNTHGLWAFEPIDYKVVRARNFPPFFAVRNKANYFLPKISWKREPKIGPPAKIEKGTVYLAGAIPGKKNKSLYLDGRGFTIPSGPKLSVKEGSAYLPYEEGTIEFFVKPISWSTFELPDQTRKMLIRGRMEGGGDFMVSHNVMKAEKEISFFASSVYRNSERSKGKFMIRKHRPNSIFEREKWTHVAIVWRQEDNARYLGGYNDLGNKVLCLNIYINGKEGTYGNRSRNTGKNSKLLGALKFLNFYIGGSAIDELRISDKRRYLSDFVPPSTNSELSLDQNTRALFHFNGNLKGESGSGQKPVLGVRR
jgi:PcRGLX-like protein central beta sandwich domain/Carbohydrate family 9 binding domain-like/PcRGLX-like N-terminal RIFT barrel domain